ncbi:MAG TPA: phage portal protein [Tissierellaceae bacterium]|nr:phage portal protein [Tissierellaceae bacterium]
MFQALLNWIRKQVSRIFPAKNIEEGLGIEIDISDVMADSIELWAKMYEDEAPWIDNKIIKSLNVPSSIASEMARLVTIEMESEVTGGVDSKGKALTNDRASYLNEQYQRVIDSLRIQTEYAAAKGGMVFKPYLDNENIAIDYVQADNFYPVRFNASGELVAAIFPEIIIKGDRTYTRLEYHDYLGNGVNYISNTSYVKGTEESGLGKSCELTDVKEWEDLEGELNIKELDQPLFSYFKMPLANNKDSKSHLGVSVYSKATKLIEEADKQYSKILWEYEGTELAIDVNLDMLNNGELPEGKERLYRKLDTEDESFYKVFNPDIRDTSLYNGLNKLLERIEFNSGLAYGTLSDVQEISKTATEIKSSKQRSYSTVVDIQKALRIALEHLIISMDYLATMYNLAPVGDYEVSFDFDDSIIIDSKEEQAIMMMEVSANLIKPEYYLMKRYGLTEEQAINMLPSMDIGIKEEDYDDME